MTIISRLFILLLLLGCADKASNAYGNTANDKAEYVLMEDLEIAETAVIEINQKIIKTSVLKWETQNLNKTYETIIRYVKQNKGFVQSDNSNKDYRRITRLLEIRIPSENFQTTLDSIVKNVAYFDKKNISAKDVTEEFIDIEARLKAKKTLEMRYLQLLSKAKNVKEMLEIERELSNIREEIEAKQGRLKYLENRVALSTFKVEFYKQNIETTISQSYGSKIGNAFKSGFNGLSLFFLGLLRLWPLIVIIIVFGYIFKNWLNKRNKK